MKNYLLLLLCISFFSCQQKENRNVTVSTSDIIVAKEAIAENIQTGDTIQMNFKNEKGFFTAEGVLDSIHPRIYVKFKSEELGKLKAKIVPTTGIGNIRFNQIIFPDKTSDGPFGMNLEFDLPQKGNYIIVIGHSLMADEPFWGKFKVQLEIKE